MCGGIFHIAIKATGAKAAHTSTKVLSFPSVLCFNVEFKAPDADERSFRSEGTENYISCRVAILFPLKYR